MVKIFIYCIKKNKLEQFDFQSDKIQRAEILNGT